MPIKADLWQYTRFHKSIPHPSNYPVISNVQFSPGGSVNWDTDVPSTSQVFYGFVPYLGFRTAYDSAYVTSHVVYITDLVPNTLYYFRVQSFRYDALSISDLYSGHVPTTGFASLVLTSPNLTRWIITLTARGALDTEPFDILTNPIPDPAYDVLGFFLRDSLGIRWSVTVDDSGHLITTSGIGEGSYADSLALIDPNQFTWVLTVDPSGNLETNRGVTPPTTYNAIILTDSDLVRWAVTVVAGDLVQTLAPTGPAGALTADPFILQSSGGILYQVTISTLGVLVTGIVLPSLATVYSSVHLGSAILTVSDDGTLIVT